MQRHGDATGKLPTCYFYFNNIGRSPPDLRSRCSMLCACKCATPAAAPAHMYITWPHVSCTAGEPSREYRDPAQQQCIVTTLSMHTGNKHVRVGLGRRPISNDRMDHRHLQPPGLLGPSRPVYRDMLDDHSVQHDRIMIDPYASHRSWTYLPGDLAHPTQVLTSWAVRCSECQVWRMRPRSQQGE